MLQLLSNTVSERCKSWISVSKQQHSDTMLSFFPLFLCHRSRSSCCCQLCVWCSTWQAPSSPARTLSWSTLWKTVSWWDQLDLNPCTLRLYALLYIRGRKYDHLNKSFNVAVNFWGLKTFPISLWQWKKLRSAVGPTYICIFLNKMSESDWCNMHQKSHPFFSVITHRHHTHIDGIRTTYSFQWHQYLWLFVVQICQNVMK